MKFASMLLVACASTAPAQEVVEWRASSGALPSAVAPSYLLWQEDPCGAATETLAGGALTIDSSACAGQIHAYQYTRSPAVPTPLPSVMWVEARVQVRSSSAPSSTIGSASLRLYPGAVCPYALELEDGQVSLRVVPFPGGLFTTVPADTTSAPRLWRLEIDNVAGEVRAYADGQLVASAATVHASTCSFTPGFEGRAAFGDFWTGNGGVADWYEVRHNLGVPVQSFCLFQAPNSVGRTATLQAQGSRVVAQNALSLWVLDAPPTAFGYFLCSRVWGEQRPVIASQGELCLAAPVGRFNRPGEVLSMSTVGSGTLPLDLGDLPQPLGSAAVQPGERWSFQFWYRDANPVPTSNFSQGLELRFE